MTPDKFSYRLDISRNKLLAFNTVITLATLVFSLGSYIGAMFGE